MSHKIRTLRDLEKLTPMPRHPRLHSDSGIYHIILRGIGRQDIFFDDDDRQMLLRMMAEVTHTEPLPNADPDTTTQQTLSIYAYCLMTNHIHLLVKEHLTEQDYEHIADAREGANVKVGISATMHRLGRKYSMWHNKKYGRTGTLFDDRFKSEPVEDMQYFLTVFRYIHRNPVKAGICPTVKDYPWSSWHEYQQQRPHLCAVQIMLARYTLAELTEYVSYDPDHYVMDFEDEPIPVSQEEALRLLHEYSGASDATAFQQLDPETQRTAAKQLLDHGLLVGQVSRITGLTYNIVRTLAGYVRPSRRK